MRTLPLLALLLALLPMTLHAEPYCKRGSTIEMYWIGEWQPVRVISGPDAEGLCMVRYGSIAYMVTRARLRPKDGGKFSTDIPAAVAVPAPKPASAPASASQ